MDRYVSLRQTQLQHNGFALSKTSGRSMRPLIWGGEHCVAVAPLVGEPAVGDLLMFAEQSGGDVKSIVHRLVGVRQEGEERIYVTRGDNCLGCEQVRAGEIIGRVAEVHRLTGFRPWHAIPRRKFAVTDRTYKLYVRVWTALWPVRRIYYQLRPRICGIKARLRSVIRSK